MPPAMRNDIFQPHKENKKDELSIFSGQTHTVATKVNVQQKTSSPQQSSPPSTTNSSLPSTAAPSPPQVYVANPSFAGVHPNLVDELHRLDGHLNAQIQNAYYVNHDAFAGSLLENQYPPQQQQQQQQPYQHQQQSLQQQQPLRQQPNQHHQPSYTVNPDPRGLLSHVPGYNAPQSQTHGDTHCPPHVTQHATYEYEPHNTVSSYPHTTQHHAHAWQDPTHGFTHYPPNASSHSQPAPQSWTGYPQHQHQPQHQPQQQIKYAPQEYTYGVPPPVPLQHSHYTPDAAMRGLAADDHSLQETWTSFMYQVGSPRQFLDNT
jgi:hypothetical protein